MNMIVDASNKRIFDLLLWEIIIYMLYNNKLQTFSEKPNIKMYKVNWIKLEIKFRTWNSLCVNSG